MNKGTNGDALDPGAVARLRAEAKTFRLSRTLLSIGTLAVAIGLVWSCDIFDCRYPQAGTDAASRHLLEVFGAFALAGIFAVQAVSGLTLRGLSEAWNAAGSLRQVLLVFVMLVLSSVLGSLVLLVFERQGVLPPQKQSPPPRSVIEQPVVRAS